MTGVSAGLTDTDLATEVTGTGASSGVTVDTMPAIDPTPKAPWNFLSENKLYSIQPQKIIWWSSHYNFKLTE